MAFTRTERGDVAGIIPEAYSNAFLDNIIADSVIMRNVRVIRIGTKVNKFPILSALPSIGWVTEADDASGVKPLTEVAWINKVITAEELAVIIPIHEDVIDDATVDLWAEIRPLVSQAFSGKIDDTVINGSGKPASFIQGLVPGAIAAGNTVAVSETVDLADAFNLAFAEVEEDGYSVDRVFSGPATAAKMRGLRDANGQFLYTPITGSDSSRGIWGAEHVVARAFPWDNVASHALVADSQRIVVGLRTDMSYKLLSEATVGGINLAERDMLALRVKMRWGWEIANPVNALSATPYPAAVITPDTTP